MIIVQYPYLAPHINPDRGGISIAFPQDRSPNSIGVTLFCNDFGPLARPCIIRPRFGSPDDQTNQPICSIYLLFQLSIISQR
jgi:hypothetical protein